MANTAAPKGLKVVGNRVGTGFNGVVNEYKIASATAANIYAGDPVKLLTTGYVTVAAAGENVRGVLVGVRYRDATGQPKVASYWPTGTVTLGSEDAVAVVADDPDVLIMAQFDAATAVTTAMIGATFDHVAGTGSAATGQSAATVGASTIGTASALLRYHGPAQFPGNDMTGYGWGLFSFIEHDYKLSTGI